MFRHCGDVGEFHHDPLAIHGPSQYPRRLAPVEFPINLNAHTSQVLAIRECQNRSAHRASIAPSARSVLHESPFVPTRPRRTPDNHPPPGDLNHIAPRAADPTRPTPNTESPGPKPGLLRIRPAVKEQSARPKT